MSSSRATSAALRPSRTKPTAPSRNSCGYGAPMNTILPPAPDGAKAQVSTKPGELQSLQPLDARDQRTVESLDSNALELVDAALGGGDQAVDVDVHAASAEGFEVGDPALPQRSRAGGVAAAQVLEADPDLEDALVEVAHRVALGQPLLLERFVLLVELATVELLDTPPQARRRRLRAAAAALPAAGSQTLHRCPKLAPLVQEYR